MKRYVFPAVFYKDEENNNYVVAFDDIPVYCIGKTIEEAYSEAKKNLKDFCRSSIKSFGEVKEKPCTYLDCQKAHKNDIILLVDAEVKDTKK